MMRCQGMNPGLVDPMSVDLPFVINARNELIEAQEGSEAVLCILAKRLTIHAYIILSLWL